MLARTFSKCSQVSSSSSALCLQSRACSQVANLLNPSIGLNEEQRLLQETATRFSRTELRPNARKWDEEHYFPVQEMRSAAQLGFAALYTPLEHGGSGLSRLESSVVFEALAQGCVGTSAFLSIHNMCTWMISKFGNKQQHSQFLPSLVSMDRLASYCLTEPNSGSDAASLSTLAKKEGDDYVLNGTKAFISGAGVSDVYLVMCRTGGPGPKGISCLIVEKGMTGLSFGKNEDKLGWNCQPTRMVHFDNCRVPAKNRLNAEGEGFRMAMQALNGGRINIASTSLGAAQHAIEVTLDHVKDRKQFGSTLSTFQNTQFRLAEAAADLLSSRLLVRAAANALDNATTANESILLEDPVTMAATAKLVATERCYLIIDQCLQLFGGYGYLKDYPLQQLLRDTRVNRILEGTNEVMRLLIARNLLKN